MFILMVKFSKATTKGRAVRGSTDTDESLSHNDLEDLGAIQIRVHKIGLQSVITDRKIYSVRA